MHDVPETDSDGDGGSDPKLQGPGHIEFSKKGIPHGILHFPLQLRLAGHIYMHDTCAPEASHRYNIRTAMDRVRKGTDSETSKSLVGWQLRVRTWAKVIDKVIDDVEINDPRVVRRRRVPNSMTVQLSEANVIRTPTRGLTFSPLRHGGDSLLCNDARISFVELGTLISHYTGWNIATVMDAVQVRLFCSARVLHTSGQRRTYWATERRYHYSGGFRRDMVEIDLGGGKIGAAQLTSFIELSYGDGATREAVLIRWLSKSSRSTLRDDYDRPLCDFPLCFNHCLWEWSDAGRDRVSFRVRGFRNACVRRKLWSHVHQDDRQSVIDSEIRARYDIISYESIKGHANIHEDPSTGHMLQTLQII